MIGNGIPANQKAVFKCPECSDEVFFPMQGVRFVYDRLAPDKMAPIPVQLFKCGGCEGYLTKDKSGAFVIVHKEKPIDDGDGWKKL